jgi:hypothetical protein
MQAWSKRIALSKEAATTATKAFNDAWTSGPTLVEMSRVQTTAVVPTQLQSSML